MLVLVSPRLCCVLLRAPPSVLTKCGLERVISLAALMAWMTISVLTLFRFIPRCD